MGLDLKRLLDVRLYQAFDADEAGRVLAGSDDTGSTQLIEITPGGEVARLTALPGRCSGLYIPGQRVVVVSHDEGGNERQQLSLLPLPVDRPAGLEDLAPLVRDPRYIHNLADITATHLVYVTNRRNGVAFDPVVRDLGNGAERQLENLGDYYCAEAALSPDGRWLALTIMSAVTANATYLALADLAVPPGEESLTFVTTPDAPAINRTPSWTPGSDALVFTSNSDREFTGVARYDLAAKITTWLVTDDGFDLSGWLSPDGTALLVERNDNGASVLTVHDSATGSEKTVPLPVTGTVVSIGVAPRWAPDSRSVALSISSVQMPGDVLLADTARASVTALTHSARAYGDDVPVLPEYHLVPAPDGERIPLRVYRPDGQDSPLTGSAVVIVHGGPEAQARQLFNAVEQGLVTAGHTVLVPNVRGSTGYGKRWYQADDVRRRLDSVADMAALHAYLPELGVDQDRAALWGGSYGGYMVLAGLAFQPSLWAAGVDIVGIASLVTFLENTSAYRRAYREREYGTLAHDRDFLHQASPLTHIDQMTAPLFIIHGANDPRVPLTEAEQIHAALTSRGRECELLVFGNEGHGLAQRGNRADAMPKAFAFLAKHLGR
ncbi:MAG TPA: alpha/beta fold hydrolase [Streptosporangiaceae bacterium]|jgi:dipeptidyl aminopeptidase/acylaminoacyl peptidase